MFDLFGPDSTYIQPPKWPWPVNVKLIAEEIAREVVRILAERDACREEDESEARLD